MTSKPFFNCGTERFVRDWTKTKIMVVVRDSRLREEDPILGVISLNLSEVFTNCSQTSRFYPIRGGIGYGKVCISLLFRSIDAQLPRNLLACDVGSVEIVSKHISCLEITDPEVRGIASIDFATPLIRKKAVRVNDGWAPVHNTHGSTGFRLGVRHRHSAPCILYFRRESKVRKNKTIAVALFWLKDLPDDEDVPLTLPVFRPDNLDRFVQNFGLGEGKQVGEIRLVVRMHRGIGHSHRRSAQKEKNFKEVIQAVECVEHIRGEGASATADLDPTTLVWDEGSESEGSVSEECTPRGHRRRESSYSAFSSVLSVDSLRPLGDIKRRMSKMSEDRKEMHRMERGMMQWKGARTLAWVGSGLKQKGRGIKDAMNMEPRRPGVETEV